MSSKFYEYSQVPIKRVGPNKRVGWIFSRYGLRRCVRARTRAMCGRTCVCACEMNSETSVRSVCVRAFFPLVTPTHVRPHTFLTFQGKLMDISDFICEL